jgi:REP element-mobilizing transposase RayT
MFRDGKAIQLWAYCIMPNHVHIVFTILEQADGLCVPLSKILHSFKRYTARECNKFLNRSGIFWQHESYDRVVRDNQEFMRMMDYVMNNPVKAGIAVKPEDWKWAYRREAFR